MDEPRYLLDTHVLLWFQTANPETPARYRKLVEKNARFVVSAVSLWEIAIKRAKNILHLDNDPIEAVMRSDVALLPIDHFHVRELERLPPLHADPFDRMLIAQARHERLTLLTVDREIRRYDLNCI